MYYTNRIREQSMYPLKDLITKFNHRTTNHDDLISYHPHCTSVFEIDEITKKKCVYELEHLIRDSNLKTDWQDNDISQQHDADEWAYYKIKHWRKAWKGLQIACFESGLTVPDNHDFEVEQQFKRYKKLCLDQGRNIK